MDTMEIVETRQLNASDRCDHGGCNSQAFTLVKFLEGELLFCGHHFARYEEKLYNAAYDIVDEREYINDKSKSSV